jgi:hypothetical protein
MVGLASVDELIMCVFCAFDLIKMSGDFEARVSRSDVVWGKVDVMLQPTDPQWLQQSHFCDLQPISYRSLSLSFLCGTYQDNQLFFEIKGKFE